MTVVDESGKKKIRLLIRALGTLVLIGAGLIARQLM
jgi:hypothetical protein